MELKREGNSQEGAWYSEFTAVMLQKAKVQIVLQKELDQFIDDGPISTYSIQRQKQFHLARRVFRSLIAR